MPNTLKYIEAAAKRWPEDSPEYYQLTREYAQELNRLWTSGTPLPAAEVCDRDASRIYPAKFGPMSLPGIGTKTWQSMARRVGVEPSHIAEAPARAELARMVGMPIPRHGRKASRHDHNTIVDVVRLFCTQYSSPCDPQFDRALEHLRAIVRRARDLGWYVESDAA